MAKRYTHELTREVVSISGRYELEREERLRWRGRQVLYVVGSAVVDSSCCGYGGCRYAVVPGFVVSWKSGRDQEGRPISEVEPVTDGDLKEEIRRLIEEREQVSQVQFW